MARHRVLLGCILVWMAVQVSTFQQIHDEYRDLRYDWSPLDKILETAIANQSFPGCVAIVGDSKGYLYATAKGHFTYGLPPPFDNGNVPKVKLTTTFDLASLTKVVATTTAVAQFYQRGELQLHRRVADILGSQFSQNGKGEITVLNCLLHNAGYPPDPVPGYSSVDFGCPESSQYHPKEVFTCQEKVWRSLNAQTLANATGAYYVYSDLSYITLMYVVGNLARTLGYVKPSELLPDCAGQASSQGAKDQCYYEAYIRKHVIPVAGLKRSGFLPLQTTWFDIAPTENDTYYRHEVMQGQVHDQNTYAMGGISGHAGLFSNALELFGFMHMYMFADDSGPILNSTTVSLFTKEYNHSQSSRALGWNTNDPTVWDYGWGLLCGKMSATTWMHTGFTGGQLCGDPVRKLITVFLTNRVYPRADNWKIEAVRQEFHDAVVDIYDHGNK